MCTFPKYGVYNTYKTKQQQQQIKTQKGRLIIIRCMTEDKGQEHILKERVVLKGKHDKERQDFYDKVRRKVS